MQEAPLLETLEGFVELMPDSRIRVCLRMYAIDAGKNHQFFSNDVDPTWMSMPFKDEYDLSETIVTLARDTAQCIEDCTGVKVGDRFHIILCNKDLSKPIWIAQGSLAPAAKCCVDVVYMSMSATSLVNAANFNIDGLFCRGDEGCTLWNMLSNNFTNQTMVAEDPITKMCTYETFLTGNLTTDMWHCAPRAAFSH